MQRYPTPLDMAEACLQGGPEVLAKLPVGAGRSTTNNHSQKVYSHFFAARP